MFYFVLHHYHPQQEKKAKNNLQHIHIVVYRVLMNAQSVNERVSERMQCNVIYMYINTLCSNIFELVSVVDWSVTE